MRGEGVYPLTQSVATMYHKRFVSMKSHEITPQEVATDTIFRPRLSQEESHAFSNQPGGFPKKTQGSAIQGLPFSAMNKKPTSNLAVGVYFFK